MLSLYEELLTKRADVQVPTLHEHLRHAHAIQDVDLYNELSRLNNELVTLQRELVRKNRELQAQREWFRVTLTSIGDAVIVTGYRRHSNVS